MKKGLPEGFSVDVDTAGAVDWRDATRDLLDANVYQTQPYEIARSGKSHVSHVIVRRNQDVVAAAQARLSFPLGLGVAYVRWGPLWKRRSAPEDPNVFRQAVRAIRNEYVVRRGLIARLAPHLADDDNQTYRKILEDEGYVWKANGPRLRTILMDIRPALDDLYKGLDKKWRNSLNSARRQTLELVEGEEDALFEAFEPLYVEMKERKQFVTNTDPDEYRRIQREALPDQKLRVFLCNSGEGVCAGAICSAMGDAGIYHFGATNALGMKNNGSYLVQWRVLEWLKEKGCAWYNLNGINPETNQGTYRFKARLAGAYGHDVHFLGQYDAYPNSAIGLVVDIGEYMKRLKYARSRS